LQRQHGFETAGIALAAAAAKQLAVDTLCLIAIRGNDVESAFISNSRFSHCAQVINARRSPGVRASVASARIVVTIRSILVILTGKTVHLVSAPC